MKRITNASFGLLAVVAASACSGPSASPKFVSDREAAELAARGTPEPSGLRVVGPAHTGTASFYAHKFHGRQTASGAIYDMHGLTAAHRELPFGTLVRVTNLANGHQAVLRVNDRGPFVGDRLIDVSLGAAKKLGFVKQGLAQVRMEILAPEP